MSARQKGQTDIEAVIAAIFAFGLLLVVLLYNSGQNDELRAMETLDLQKNQCAQISSIISLMQSNKTTDSIEITLPFDTAISGNTILIGNYYCYFTGYAQNANISDGKIKIFESNGVILLENA